METSFVIYIHFTDEWVEADISSEQHDAVFDAFYQLEHIDEVCLNKDQHECWVSFSVGNPTLQSLTELAEQFEKQTKKIIDDFAR